MTGTSGAVTGGVRTLLRLEGLAVLVLSVLLYARSDASWGLFALLVLAPDLGLLGYLAGSRVGAATYNAVHTYVGPLAVIAICGGTTPWTSVALIWTAHIGMDRSIAFGLKYASGFHASHLGTVGKVKSPANG